MLTLKKRTKIRHAEYYDMIPVTDKLYADSLKGKIFTNLMELITSEENIKLAYRNIKKNTGSDTPGVDNITIKNVGKWTEMELISQVRKRLSFYKPQPVRRVEIPKPNGKKRPLGIPTMSDRIIQQCILQILEPICEAKFHERSNGFRPNRSAENAISQCNHMMFSRGLHYVVDVDIKGFFDNVDHNKLKRQIWSMGIRDKKLICIISEMLKAPICMPDKSVIYPTKGTPQGGILSPLLANIVLNELDWWIASQWETMPTRRQYAGTPHQNGTMGQNAKFRALKGTKLKEMYIVRYADDFKIFCRNRTSATKILIATQQWLWERLKLEVSVEKSQITNLKRKYSEFLGFRMKVIKSKNQYVSRTRMTEKAVANVKGKLKGQRQKIEHPKDGRNEYEEISKYNAMVIGIHNYYRIATLVNLDCNAIAWQASKWWKKKAKQKEKAGPTDGGYVESRYGKSAQIRYISGHPIAPIGYVQYKKPMWKKKSVNKYTPEGRKDIHTTLTMNMDVLLWLMRHPVKGRSIEYADNRISLFSAQKGKCAITGKELEPENTHCHHKKPRKLGGDDSYHNLILVLTDVHKLIHATNQQTIEACLKKLNLNAKMVDKVNKLRVMAQLEPIMNK